MKEFSKIAFDCMEAGHWEMKDQEPYICKACFDDAIAQFQGVERDRDYLRQAFCHADEQRRKNQERAASVEKRAEAAERVVDAARTGPISLIEEALGMLILKAFCERCVKWYNPKYGTRYDAGNRPRCPACESEIVTVEVAEERRT